MAGTETSKKKYTQCNVDYLKYWFIESPTNKHMPMCLICEKVFSNETMKPSRLGEHLRKAHPEKAEIMLIAKSRKPHTVGEELILLTIKETQSTVLHKTAEFAFELDESTLPCNEFLLLAQMHFIKDENLAPELLFARQLEADTKNREINFRFVNVVIENSCLATSNWMLRNWYHPSIHHIETLFYKNLLLNLIPKLFIIDFKNLKIYIE
ncbi:hypothetical protein J437_LFUL013485 [Ladona fulva]|uniref:BED-type domain-containing protein n=1 Tax=Ladona fulva TaxID=123851 RepID=A0A8K0KJP2_LADFU|nr:hypothetical protein J437_LFUL013485 [Ladona fulva]